MIASRLPKNLPFNLRKYKGSTHWFLNYKAVEYVIKNPGNVSLTLRAALAPYRSDCEALFQILQFNPQLHFPGGMTENPETGLYRDLEVHRHKLWCYGKGCCPLSFSKRGICVLGVKYLSELVNKSYGRKLAANKFPRPYQPMAWDCMQVWHMDKVQQEYRTGTVAMNISYFVNNSYVKYGRKVAGF